MLNCRKLQLEATGFVGLIQSEACIDELRLLVAIRSCPVLLTVSYLAPGASYPLRYRVDVRGFCRTSCARRNLDEFEDSARHPQCPAELQTKSGGGDTVAPRWLGD